jgi:uncharacterized protein YdaU (DUF1376 family)
MPKVDIWMPWYIAEYQADTAHLNPPQDSAYRRLLEHQWKTRRPLPNDVLALIQITKMSHFFVDATSIPLACVEHASSIGRASASKEDRMLYAWILDLLNQFFHQNPDGTWSQLRLEKELRVWGEKSDVATEKARRAAWNRWHPNEPYPGDAPSITQAEPEQSPSSSSGKLKSKYQQRTIVRLRPEAGKRVGSVRSSERPKGETKTNPKNVAGAIGEPLNVSEVAPRRSERAKVPQKSVAHATKTGGESTKTRPETDPRFGSFRDEFFKFWKEVNRKVIAEGKVSPACPWGPRERSELARWLAINTAVSLPMLQALLLHRAASELVVASQPPYIWIKDLSSYAYGPLDRYKKPQRSRPGR